MQQPRQMYGLGSLVKSIGKGVKSGIKGITSTIKENPMLALAALNFAPMLTGGNPFIGMAGAGKFAGTAGNIPGLSLGSNKLANTLKVGAIGTVLGGVLGSLSDDEEEEISTGRNIQALETKLTKAYMDLNYDPEEIPGLVQNDLSEYNKDMNRPGAMNGGRMGYGLGNLVTASMQAGDNPVTNNGGMSEMLSKLFNNPQLYASLNKSDNFIDENFNGIDDRQEASYGRQEAAYGGRMGFARGPDSPEQNAIQAAGIEGLQLNQNPAGVTELDLRETGGFIPPVGVKEKADDIPAMLSNNEFVMTADAVTEFGDGDVNKGAQRMYDMMKKLENGGRV